MSEQLIALVQWCTDNQLIFKIQEDFIVTINNEGPFLFIESKMVPMMVDEEEVEKELIFDTQMNLVMEFEEVEAVQNVKYYVFYFGDQFFYQPVNNENKVRNPKLLKNIGTYASEIELPYSPLGVRGEYELLNGCQSYDRWIEKARFYGYQSLGICEKNTLAGTLAFQLECDKNKMHCILGETITIRRTSNETDFEEFEGKCYVTNSVGWQNLLRINKIINVDNVLNGKWIEESDLLKLGEGLIFIFSSQIELSDELIELYFKNFDRIYYQFDCVEYSSNDRDMKHLLRLQTYLKQFKNKIQHVFIQDMFYVEKEWAHLKKILNSVAKKSEVESRDQYFKSLDTTCFQMLALFGEDNEEFFDFFEMGCLNTVDIAESCDFVIDLKTFKLPKYTFKYNDLGGEELFYYLIETGFAAKFSHLTEEEQEVYYNRINEELEVINEGDLQDYFMILWDICKWSRSQNIPINYGRGSAAGCLIMYLLDIIKINPLDYDLLFARFLNRSRIKENLPDVDLDFPGLEKDSVKQYIIDRFGYENTCFTGTYSTLKPKGALKDFGREMGVEFASINYVNSAIEEREEWKWFDLFEYAQTNPTVKKFIYENHDLIKNIYPILDQPRSASIHASAVIITPSFDKDGNPMTIFDWMPVKMMDGAIVSEWEGVYLEKAGFLKEDILAIQQLDKIKAIDKLIKEVEGEDFDIFNPPLNCQATFDLFQQGLNEDVFHFGSPGLKVYSQEVKPSKIEDLIAMNALYRPGPMGSNAHNRFVLRRQGKELVEYDWGTEEITKNTYGLYVFQEQGIKIVQVVGGLSESEADNVRRAIGKKNSKLMDSYKTQFITGAESKGCSFEEAEKIWKKINEFAQYSFNASHAASYSTMAYLCQWLKANYPLEFWTVSLTFAPDHEVGQRIAELKGISQGIQLMPPDINNSQPNFALDRKTKSIYWSISRVSHVGEAALLHILEERELNGRFYSLEEFIKRIQKKKCNKRTVTNLILSGAFDECENVKNVQDRFTILKKYSMMCKEELDPEYTPSKISSEHFWILIQKDMCGYGFINFKALLSSTPIDKKKWYMDPLDFFVKEEDEQAKNKNCLIAGQILEIKERQSKKGAFANVILDHNGIRLNVVCWNTEWSRLSKAIPKSNKTIMFISGKRRFDSFKKTNVLATSEDSEWSFI